MTQSIREVMTTSPMTCPSDAALVKAAQFMRERDLGDVLVEDAGAVCGIVTDRDIVVRAVAEGRDPNGMTVGEICSRDLITLSSTDSAEDAIRLMREHALRRLPIVDGGRAVGIVSIGDLAQQRDPESTLADISAAPPNL